MDTTSLLIALSQYGLKEKVGLDDNPVIMQMALDCGFKDYIHDSIAWCSLFANWVALKSGYERSHALNARSWLAIGDPVVVPELMDIVVLWRDNPKSSFGHVGFFINKDSVSVYLLAGNQADMVNVSEFGYYRVLGYRRLKKVV